MSAPTFCDRCGGAVEEVCKLWDEHAELDALSERLSLKRYDLKRKFNRLQSPINHRLPPDIISTIFEFCLRDFTDHQVSPYTEEDLSIPLSLGAICSYWRDIAWSTPTLWSSLVIRVTRKHDSLTTDIAEEWLARSGQLPLTIRISSRKYINTVSALANIINQYSSRWFDLDLYIPDHYYKYFHATNNHAPLLKSIRFHCPSNKLKNLNFRLTCPRLERASLSNFPVDGTNIQWDNLTHLTLDSISIIDSFRILRKAPRLVFCNYLGFCTSIEGRSIGAPVFASLRSLQLPRAGSAEGFLNSLIAPHLEELSLPDYSITSMETITSFLRRSACSLRSFSTLLSGLPPYFEGFMNLLQSMPSLNTLSIKSVTTIARPFDIATTPEDYDPRNILQLVDRVLSSQSTSLQQGFLPNLKILEYTGKLHLRPGNYDERYSLPPADNSVHVPLHLLKLNIPPATRLPKDMVSYLSSLVERGVTVNVLNDSEDIFQSSIDYYRRRKDFLCRDWIDDFESSFFS